MIKYLEEMILNKCIQEKKKNTNVKFYGMLKLRKKSAGDSLPPGGMAKKCPPPPDRPDSPTWDLGRQASRKNLISQED